VVWHATNINVSQANVATARSREMRMVNEP
jgi:hypothetical protein